MRAMKKANLSELFAAAVIRHGTQANVARKCGISPSMVSLYIAGKVRSVTAGNVLKIAHCLGVPTAVLLGALEKSVQPRTGLSG